MNYLHHIVSKYSMKQLAIRLLEEYIWILPRSWPGFEGYVLRWLFLKMVTKRISGFCYIAPGCTFTNSYGISIGKNLAVNRNTIIDGSGGVEIGDNVGIGPNTVIMSQRHTMLGMAGNGPHLQDPRRQKVVIGNGAWIGANCFIEAGCVIGTGAVVAACSNLGRSVGDGMAVIGNPARSYIDEMRHLRGRAAGRTPGERG
jgi:acetyltransferase-like isoleucine patch superfamily enzyme